MSGQDPETLRRDTSGWQTNDEIDLRYYLETLVRWRREILLITLLSAAAAAAVVLVIGRGKEPIYRASSDVAIARVVSDISFDERYRTQADESTATATAAARRAALLVLVESGAIAERVLVDIAQLLPPNSATAADLLALVDAAFATSSDNNTQSDLIRITVHAHEPELAATIANRWAEHYVAEINRIYGRVPGDVIESLQTELSQAETSYQTAQGKLEAFVADNRIATLTRQIAEKQTLITDLQQDRQNTLRAVVNRDRDVRLTMFNRLVDAQVEGLLATFDQQAAAQVRDLAVASTTLSLLRQFAAQVDTLMTQVAAAGDANSAGNQTAIQLLKAQIFATTLLPDQPAPVVQTDGQSAPARTNQSTTPQANLLLPNNLVVNLDSTATETVSAQAQLADLTALADAVQERITATEATIERLTTALLDGSGYRHLTDITPAAAAISMQTETTDNPLSLAINRQYAELFMLGALAQTSQSNLLAGSDPLAANIQTLEADLQTQAAALEAETAQQLLLTQQRDLTRNTYNTLANKVVELTLQRSAANSEVRLGASAIPPIQPLPGASTPMAAAVAGAVGLLLGLIVAFVADFLGKRPFLARA